MILRARKIDGVEALRMGLITELVPLEQIKERAQALGEELAAQPRLAVKGVLDTVVNFDSKTLNQSIEDEKKASKNTLNTPDWQEGMAAFSEKRRPVFNQDQE
jgi:enoyl-CoA hydratase